MRHTSCRQSSSQLPVALVGRITLSTYLIWNFYHPFLLTVQVENTVIFDQDNAFSQTVTNLTIENEIPKPNNSGSSGKQEPAKREVLPAEPQKGLPVVDAIEKGLAASPRALGEFGSAMLAGAARQLAEENQELKKNNNRLHQLMNIQRDDLEHERIHKAVLAQQVESERGNRHFRNFGITVGTALASTGLLRSLNIIDGSSMALSVLGVLLLVVAWLIPFKRANVTLGSGDKN